MVAADITGPAETPMRERGAAPRYEQQSGRCSPVAEVGNGGPNDIVVGGVRLSFNPNVTKVLTWLDNNPDYFYPPHTSPFT